MAPNAHSALRRSAAERFLAWLYTGPVGHLYGPLADIVVLLSRFWAGRVRARLRALAAQSKR